MARLVRHDLDGPIKIEPQAKAVWICGCGLTRTFPICDKSHKACAGEEKGYVYVYDPATGAVVERRPDPVRGVAP